MTDKTVYSIGKVARLTGLSTHTIRKWEQRYQAVEPLRSPGGDRRYDRGHVERLRLLHQLSPVGAIISDIATLPTATLRQFAEHQRGTAAAAPSTLQVGVIGDSLPTLLSTNQAQMPKLCFVPVNLEDDPADRSTPPVVDRLDALIIERSLLNATTAQELAQLRSRSGVASLVVVYSFATQAQAAALSDQQTACVRTPINYIELQRTLRALVPTSAPRMPIAPSEPRYSKRLLAKIATLPPSMACECPRHIAELLVALGEFESYSAECQHRQPRDAAIHAYLKETAADARSAFERALETVAEHEHLALVE